MVDITQTNHRLRQTWVCDGLKTSTISTIKALQENTVPKGNVFEMARAAGLLGVKKTPDILPDCHPIPIEYASIDYEISGLKVIIKLTIKTIYKTGVEVEAMHGVSIVALTMYDMLKPIDKNISIENIKLDSKKGGKSSFQTSGANLTAKVIVCSDSISKGDNSDKSGMAIAHKLSQYDVKNQIVIIPDDPAAILQELEVAGADIIIYTGGTGVGKRDNTPQTLEPILDLRLAGVEEQMRAYGQQRMPYAMLSRSIAGIKGQQLILSLPGSEKGVIECMDSIFPHVMHVFKVIVGTTHKKYE